jgi:hypothetical protein
MLPHFFVRPDGLPDVDWDDPADPRFFLAHFIGSEIYLFLVNAEDFLQAVAAVERGDTESWRWGGNSYTVELGQGRCTIADDWWFPDSPSPEKIELTLDEFRTVIAAWRDFVAGLPSLRKEEPGTAGDP